MKLDELYTLNHLPIGAPTVDPATDERLKHGARYTRLTDFADQLRLDGFKPLGRGAYGLVFTNPTLGYAVKLFNQDDVGFKGFLRFVLNNRGNPHLPQIRGRFKQINKDYSACRMELLSPLQGRCSFFANKLHHIVDEDQLDSVEQFVAKAGSQMEKSLRAVFTDPFLETLFAVAQYGRAEDLGLDLHDGNFMMRGQTLVITDPF